MRTLLPEAGMLPKLRPDDLIATSEAAKIAERSERTIRRWTQPEIGKLSRWLGEPAIKGGASPVLVSRRELMDTLAISHQEPRLGGRTTSTDTKDTPPLDMRSSATDIRLAVLEERLLAAELRTQLASVSAERDGLARQVEDLQRQAENHSRRTDDTHAELRSDLDAERDRTRALEAELRALRELHGVSWWQKLLGGPTAPALEAK